MFSVNPYSAERYTTSGWQPCRVIGVDKDDDGDLAYVVEVRDADGTFYLTHEDTIRKPAPTA